MDTENRLVVTRGGGEGGSEGGYKKSYERAMQSMVTIP